MEKVLSFLSRLLSNCWRLATQGGALLCLQSILIDHVIACEYKWMAIGYNLASNNLQSISTQNTQEQDQVLNCENPHWEVFTSEKY